MWPRMLWHAGCKASAPVTSFATIVSAFAGMHPRTPLRAAYGSRQLSGHAQRTERATPRQHEKLRAEGQIIRSAALLATSGLACAVFGVGATGLPDHDSLFAFARHAVKLLALGFITYDLLITSRPLLFRLAFLPATSGAASVGTTARKRAFRLTVAFALAAAADRWLVQAEQQRAPDVRRALPKFSNRIPGLAVPVLREVDPKATVRTLGVVSA
jgi:hypothetical protein